MRGCGRSKGKYGLLGRTLKKSVCFWANILKKREKRNNMYMYMFISSTAGVAAGAAGRV